MCDNNKEAIIDKVRKLLALTESNNQSEAEVALLRARELMAKYKLAQSDIEVKTEDVELRISELEYTNGYTPYILQISKVIADNNCCDVYVNTRFKSKKYKIGFIGYKQDIDLCIEMIKYAIEFVQMQIKDLKAKCKDLGYTSKAINYNMKSYGAGFAAGLASAYKKQNEENQEYGLVLVKPQEVVEETNKMESFNVKLRYNPRSDLFNMGFTEGVNYNHHKRIED